MFNKSVLFSVNMTLKWMGMVLLFLLWLAPTGTVLSQDEGEEEVEKARARMGLTVTQMPGDSIELNALLRAKIDGSYQKISEAEIEFFSVGTEEEVSLGKQTTGANGVALLKVSAANLSPNEDGYLSFIARFGGNDEVDEDETDASILKASISLSAEQEDSLLYLTVKALAPSEEGEVPLEEADVVFFVKRMVGKLKVGEGTTDENGEARIAFPIDLAGDNNGNVFITAQIEDFGEYGNLAASIEEPWGRPVSYEIKELPRALWSPNPPVWMVITFFILMVAVWGHYMVIIYNLSKLNKDG